MERVMEVTEGKVIEEEGRLRKGKGCVYQIFVIKMMVEECWGKDGQLYAVFMDLKIIWWVAREALLECSYNTFFIIVSRLMYYMVEFEEYWT